MRSRKRHDVGRLVAESETSSVSPLVDADDEPFEPSSETGLTEPDYPPPAPRKTGKNGCSPPRQADSKQPSASKPSKGFEVSAMELVHRTRYEAPADDTDKDLSKVPEDYGKSKNTKKLNIRLQDRWALYCRTKAIEPLADLKWEDAEEALRQASLNDMHRYLNWCLKLQYNPNGRRLKGYKRFSALEADWKYFRVYYTRITRNPMSKEMGEAVRIGMQYLADKHYLDKQVRENIPVYI